MLDFNIDDLWESELDRSRGTSDQLRSEARQFLSEATILTENLSSVTIDTLSSVEAIRLPAKGEQMRIRTQKQMNMISFVLAAAIERGHIDELIVSTYTLNKEAFDILQNLVRSGKVKSLILLVASSYTFRDPTRYEEMKSACRQMKADGFDVSLIFAWLHFKLTLMRCGDDCYHIEGSMNYSMNNMAEQVMFENRREIYDFDRAFMLDTVVNSGLASVEVAV